MHDDLVFEQFHLTLTVPRELPPADAVAVRRTLDGPVFRTALRRAAAAVVRRYPALAKVRITLSR